MYGVEARLLPYSTSSIIFYQILLIGQVKYNKNQNGRNRWVYAKCHGVIL